MVDNVVFAYPSDIDVARDVIGSRHDKYLAVAGLNFYDSLRRQRIADGIPHPRLQPDIVRFLNEENIFPLNKSLQSVLVQLKLVGFEQTRSRLRAEFFGEVVSNLLQMNRASIPDLVVSPWTVDTDSSHCYMRYIVGRDPKDVSSRVAFIEKTPRVRVRMTNPLSKDLDFKNWDEGPEGCGFEAGKYLPSRQWCDDRLREMGYRLDSSENVDAPN